MTTKELLRSLDIGTRVHVTTMSYGEFTATVEYSNLQWDVGEEGKKVVRPDAYVGHSRYHRSKQHSVDTNDKIELLTKPVKLDEELFTL